MDQSQVLIIGAKGMLGKELAGVFSEKDPILWDRDDLDITNEAAVREVLANLKPKLIINAAAYTNVDACETDQETCAKVNGEAVWYLAKTARAIGAAFVHYSTDYVFDGKKEEGYAESDEPINSVNEYGLSKLLGERLLREEGDAGLRYFLIRTSWLFGRYGKNFVSTMLEAAKTRDTLKVVSDQNGKPTCAQDLAVATRQLIEGPYEPGIYHITNEPETTWFGFATEIFNSYASQNPDFKKPVVTPCESSEFPRPAKRPEHSILLNTKFPPLRLWSEALREYFTQTKSLQ
ncbi:MAG: dTDP-4-dehydrorhamnose reductase [bacterium]|nr:dTDP-4-dehydrorhamnose reductase [bacterium]